MMTAGSRESEPVAGWLEDRLAKFTQSLATAIANAESRAELDSSRARIVATADATRRRIERDLHDGAQQRLVSLALEVRAVSGVGAPGARRASRGALPSRRRTRRRAGRAARDCSAGSTRRSLPTAGSAPALKTLARRSPVRSSSTLESRGGCRSGSRWRPSTLSPRPWRTWPSTPVRPSCRLPSPRTTDVLRVSVRDDGLGGADPDRRFGPARPEGPRRGDRRHDLARQPARCRNIAGRRAAGRGPRPIATPLAGIAARRAWWIAGRRGFRPVGGSNGRWP